MRKDWPVKDPNELAHPVVNRTLQVARMQNARRKFTIGAPYQALDLPATEIHPFREWWSLRDLLPGLGVACFLESWPLSEMRTDLGNADQP